MFVGYVTKTHGEKGIYTDCWNRDKNIYYFRFFQSCFLTIVGIKENPQMGRMDYLESVFLKLKLFFRF